MALADLEFGTSSESSVQVIEYTRAHVFDTALMVNFLDSKMELVDEPFLVHDDPLLHHGVDGAGHYEVGIYIWLHEVK